MKTNFFVIAALAASALLASCDKDDNRMNPEEEGKATSMKILMNFPKAPQTRATSDDNATDAEAKVNTVDVFIYYTSSGSFQSHTKLRAENLEQVTSSGNYDLYRSKVDIETTTGAKSVVAGVNLPQSVVDKIVNKPLSTLTSVAQDLSRSDLTGTNGFVMFSTEIVKAVFVEEENPIVNNVTLECQRLVAKVTVETADNMTQDGVPGKLGALEFAVNNFNTKLFMLQGDAPYFKDPNWAADSYVASDYDALSADYAPILRRVPNDNPNVKTDYTPRYAAENSSEGKLQKELTRVTVRSTFIPDEITVFKNGSNADNGFDTKSNGAASPETFYAVTPLTEPTAYFGKNDYNIALAYAKGNAADVLTYVDGVCYWTIFLNKNPLNNTVNRWDVLRNDFYKCNITRIVTPGRPTPETPKPEEKPDGVEINITAGIEILHWHTPITSNYTLE